MTHSSAAPNAPSRPLVERIRDVGSLAANEIIKLDHFPNHCIEATDVPVIALARESAVENGPTLTDD